MAVVEIICPFCQSRQKVPEQRLAQPVNCLKCQQVIEEPFQHKVAPAQMQLNIALKGKIVNDFGTTQLEEVESRSDAYTGRKATASVEPEREELAAMGTVSEYTSVSGNYAAVPARTRVLTAAARTYLIGGVLIVLVLGVVTVIGLSLMEDEKEIRNVEGAGGNERVERHPNGRERLRYSVKRLPGGDEVMDGQWQEFYSGGEKKGLGTFVEGKEQGLWQTWHQNGQIESRGNYVDGARDGVWETFHVNGAKAERTEWDKGRQIGEARRWYHTGQAESVMRFVDGKLDGDWLEWHENGEPRLIYHYAAGRKVGTWRRYSDTGKLQFEENYQDGLHQGPTWGAYRNGQREFEGTWQAGLQTGSWTWWHPNGNRRRQGSYVEGRQDGLWQEWHENGNLRLTETWVNGMREGLVEEFWPDGSLAMRREYKEGTGGPETLWYAGLEIERRSDRAPDGTLRAQWTVLVSNPDTRHGEYRAFHADGKTVSEQGLFVQGKRQGTWRYFNPQGQQTAERRFEDGKETQ